MMIAHLDKPFKECYMCMLIVNMLVEILRSVIFSNDILLHVIKIIY